MPADARFTDVARQLQADYPGLSIPQLVDVLRRANPDAIDPRDNQPRTGSALLLPSPKNAARLLGLAPVVPPEPAMAAPAPAPAPAADQPPAEQQETARPAQPLPRQTGDAQADFLALSALLDARAGEPTFDYRYGVTAIDAGYYSEGVLALQRVLFVEPGFAGARFDLARAHYALGDYDTAAEEFARVAASNPPPLVETRTQQYLARIAEIEAEQTAANRPLSARLGVIAGYDSNANAATSENTFLGIPLDSNSRTTESAYYGIQGGLDYRRAVTERVNSNSQLVARVQQWPDADFVDTVDIRGSTGLSAVRGAWRHSLGIGGHYATLDDRFNNRGARVDAGLAWSGERLRADLALRYGALRFRDALSIQDVDQIAAGLTGSFLASPRVLISLTALAGEDDATEAGSPYSRDLVGLRLRYNQLLAPSTELRFAASHLVVDYDGQFFGIRRDDDQTNASAAIYFRGLLPGALTLVPQLRYTDNQSNVTLFDYDRTVVGLLVQREF